MKFRQRISTSLLITMSVSFFVVPTARGQQNQERLTLQTESVRLAPRPPDPPPPTPIKGNELQALAIKRVLPVYPPVPEKYRVSAAVIVRVTIDKKGAVTSAAHVIGPSWLLEVAGRASLGWRWDPALVQGTPNGITGHIRFDFDKGGTVSINTSTDPAVVDWKVIRKAELLVELEQHLEQLRAAPSPALYEKVGQVYFRLDRIEESIETLRKGLGLYPEALNLYGNLAGFYLKRDQHKEAVRVLEQGTQLGIGPDSPIQTRDQFVELLFFLSYLYISTGRDAEAKETLERAVSLNPSEKHRKPLHATLEKVDVKLGDKEATIARAEKYMERGDRDSALTLLVNLSERLVELGDKKSAESVIVLANEYCSMKVFKPRRK